MSVSTLKTKVRNLADDLSQQGFEHFAPYLVRRSRPNLAQFIELQPGHRSVEGKFTCNMAWKFTDPEIPGDNTFHHAISLERWFPHEPREALEESYAQLLRMSETYVLPFLDSVDSLEKLVAQYEGALASASDSVPAADSPLFFFGQDAGWKHCRLGFAYKNLAQLEKAREHLELVVKQHSHYPYDWVAKRKEACEKAIAAGF